MMNNKGKRFGEGVKNMVDASRIPMYNIHKEGRSLDKNRTEHF